MGIQPQPQLTPEEYLALERQCEAKHEYYAGKIYAMAGASRKHVAIVTNISYVLVGQLKGRSCVVFASDLRVKVGKTGLYTYPDIVVVCGESHFDDEHEDTLLNPTVIVEVLSESTEAYDRGQKFAHYRTLGSLSDYLLVTQDSARIEHFRRQPGNVWLFSEVTGLGDTVIVDSISCRLPLTDVYDKVNLGGPGQSQRLVVVKEDGDVGY